MKGIIGKKFKRDKYSLSEWTDEVVKIYPIYQLDEDMVVINYAVIGKLNRHPYMLDEIKIL